MFKHDVLLLRDSRYAAIAGGDVIGGGRANSVTAPNATIPGGDSLIAQSYAQTVVGYNNVAAGSFTKGTSHVFAGPIQDEPLFIVGNGTDQNNLSDAFHVSYDGHTTVFDKNNTGGPGGRSAILGSTYQDNVVYAWADIPATNGHPLPEMLILNSDFGVANVWHTANGTYVVTLNTKSDPTTPVDLTQASITLTLENNDTTGVGSMFTGLVDSAKWAAGIGPCGYATSSQIGILTAHPSSFIVHTYVGNGPAGQCNEQEHAFFLKVTGRKP